MDLFAKCKELYEKIRYFEYGIPVDGTIKPVPSAEYYVKNYHFLKPEEFEKYKGGICWDYVEYERKFLEVNDIDFNQYYLITNTPPNYDTHTFVTVKDGDDLIYIESSFKRVEHIIDGVQKFKSLEDIVKLITTNMWECNGNDKRFDEFKYDVCKFKGHPQYGCTCEEYMKWMDDNSDIVIQDVSINPKKVSQEELPVEEFTVNKIDTKFTQFVCESATNDPEEYDEALHDHLEDEDDIYNESWVDFKNGVHPSSGLMFHVSLKNDMDGKTITPQLPSYITDGGKLDDNYQEDTKTKRLCVSPSIEGCMIAILNYKKIREHVGDKFYVYTPEKPFSQYKHKTNKEIVKNKLVFDANITKEAWILEPCKLKLYGIIKLKKVKDLKKKPTVEKNIKMNTIKLDYEWIMTPKASGKFNKAIGDSPDEESDKKEKPIKEYTAIMEGFYDDKAKSHSGGVYGIYDLSDDYSTNFCNIILQGHNTEYLGWNAPKGEELIRKTFEVIRSEEWTFNKSDRKNVIPDYSNIFTYASQILPIIRLDALGEEHIKDLKAPSTLFTVHDPNSDTDIKYLCVIPQVLDVIDKSKTSYVYDEGMDDLFADHIVYNSDLINRLGMFRVKHDHPVAGTYDDNEFFQTIFRGPTISSNLFDIFNNFNSIRLFDISDVSAWDLAVDAEEHYRSDGRKINPGDPDHPYNKSVTESTNVLVSNEEFFMEVSKYERRLNKQFQREYEKAPALAKYDYVGNEKHPRNSDKYTRERINRVTQQRKDYEKASNIENSSVKRRNSSNKNKLKALKLLDYDPKTNTIKGNITLPDGSKKKRVPYIIENEVARNMGPFVGTIDEVRSMFDSIDFTNDKKPSSTELSRRQKVLNTLDQFEKNGEKFVIMIPRKFLNQRHLAGAGASLHELGHFTYIHDPNQSEETERAKAFRDSIKDKLTENTPSYMHLVKNPMGDISATYGIDESNEFSADKYAADRIGIKNYERMLKKLIKFGKKATNKAVISQINATETQLNLLKSSNGDSNYKDILNYIKGSAETFSRWSNEAQESVVQYKSKIKDLDKNIADINRKINEFKDHTSEISDELKELYKALESAKDERDSAVEELKSKRESAKSNTDSADKLFNNASFAAQYKALKSSINNFKKWMDDYDVELNERINYIKKYHEKKNIGESCLIMDNEEFFGLTK